MIFRSKWPDWGYRFDEEARVEFSHISVLLDETIDGLSVRPEGTYVDGTLGGGGHSEKVLTMLNDQGRLIGIDQDTEAINAASERLKRFKNVTFVHNNYCNFKQELTRLGIEKVDGIMLDLGVSSYQLDNPQRGFSYKTDSPLDMRMDTSNEMTARAIESILAFRGVHAAMVLTALPLDWPRGAINGKWISRLWHRKS